MFDFSPGIPVIKMAIVVRLSRHLFLASKTRGQLLCNGFLLYGQWHSPKFSWASPRYRRAIGAFKIALAGCTVTAGCGNDFDGGRTEFVFLPPAIRRMIFLAHLAAFMARGHGSEKTAGQSLKMSPSAIRLLDGWLQNILSPKVKPQWQIGYFVRHSTTSVPPITLARRAPAPAANRLSFTPS